MTDTVDTCSFESCEHPVFVHQTPHGPLCNGHYAQMRRGRVLRPLRKRRPRARPNQALSDKPPCAHKDCGRPAVGNRKWCATHDHQMRTHGTTWDIRPYRFQSSDVCSHEGCDQPPRAKGMCRKHYRQSWGPCKRKGCPRSQHTRSLGLCWRHYQEHRALENQEESD